MSISLFLQVSPFRLRPYVTPKVHILFKGQFHFLLSITVTTVYLLLSFTNSSSFLTFRQGSSFLILYDPTLWSFYEVRGERVCNLLKRGFSFSVSFQVY